MALLRARRGGGPRFSGGKIASRLLDKLSNEHFF